MITASKVEKFSRPPIQVTMDAVDADRIRDMIFYMITGGVGPLSRTLSELDEVLESAGARLGLSPSPFKGEMPVLREGA